MSLTFLRVTTMSGAVIGAFIFSHSRFAQYDVQFTAVVFAIYFLLKHGRVKVLSGKSGGPSNVQRLIEAVMFTFLVTSLINTTGGLQSPLFFLYYFLIFAISLILEPSVALATTASVVLLYLLFGQSIESLRDYIPLISLPFLTPFALFLGSQYQKLLVEQNVIRHLSKKNTALVSTLHDEEEHTFLFLSLTLRSRLKIIKEALENFMGDTQLETIQRQVNEIEKSIDEFENQKQS